jgi:hypothetical protein
MPKRLTENGIRALHSRAILDGPESTGIYRHRDGGLYEVIANALEEATHAHVVVYRSLATGVVWTRPIGEWRERFAEEDRGSIVEAMAALRAAGGHAWDAVADPAEELGRKPEADR